jgi:hypothetical protein
MASDLALMTQTIARRTRFAAVVTAAVLLMSPVAAAQEVPEDLRGFWNTSTCSNTRAAVALSRDFAILLEAHPESGALVTMGPVKWSGETAVLWQGGGPTVLPPPAAMSRCEAMPAPAYATLGEALALFSALDEMGNACAAGSGFDCASAIFGFADVSDDDQLSVAEITRLLRAVAIFVTYETMVQGGESDTASIKVPMQNLTGSAMFLSLTGPLVTRNLLASYDFDGDGFLRLDEIVQDREPLFDAEITDATGATLGAAFAQSIMSEAVAGLIRNSSQLLAPLLGGMLR